MSLRFPSCSAVPRSTLLIDFDGVIRRWKDNDAAIEARFGLPVGAIRAVAFSPRLLTPAILGVVSDESWRASVVAELERQHAAAAGEIVRLWSEPPGEVDAETTAILARCRPGVRLVLATNATSRLDRDLQALGLANRFHAVVNSSEVGATKPSAVFFEAALRRAGVRADEALFVDDSLANVEAAASVGMLAHLFCGHDALRAFLQESEALNESTP